VKWQDALPHFIVGNQLNIIKKAFFFFFIINSAKWSAALFVTTQEILWSLKHYRIAGSAHSWLYAMLIVQKVLLNTRKPPIFMN